MDLFKNDIIEVIIRSLAAFSILFVITKILGKRQMSDLSLFDYVASISVGNFASEIAINLEADWINAMSAMIIFGMCTYFISVSTMKSIICRRIFTGIPSLLINHGEILYKNMKKNKYDINDLLEEARSNGYFDLSEIDFAVLEANGKVSFMPKGDNKPLTVKDMNLKAKKQGLCVNVIIDGNIMKKHLENIGKNEDWLTHELKVQGKRIGDILLATIDINDKLVLYEKKDNEEEINSLNIFE